MWPPPRNGKILPFNRPGRRKAGRRFVVPKPKRGKTIGWKGFVIAGSMTALGGVVMGSGLMNWPLGERPVAATAGRAALGSPGSSARFGACKWGGGINCVVDGDTLWIDGEDVRVADIDAPETHDYHCQGELVRGEAAAARLQALVNSGPVTLDPIDRDEDRYGRKLRIVKVAGTSVGDTLVSEGLARWYEGGRRSWCA
jgi:micrococcal nuclease